MLNKTLMDFLYEETGLEDLGNEKLLHEFPEFGEEVGMAINNGILTEFTKELSERLKDMDLYKASLLSNLIGFACEREGNTSAGQGIIELFAHSCTTVAKMFQEMEASGQDWITDDKKELYCRNKDWARAYYGFHVLCISSMAFLARDASLRELLSELGISDSIHYLSEEAPDSPYLNSIHYINDIQNTCSDLKLLVLYPEKKKGFLAAANDLNNCFHLLFLLEEQIYRTLRQEYGMNAFHADDSLISLAHGNYPDDCWDKSYHTYFMECNYQAALHDQFENSDAMSLIWGEMPPALIPEIDGYKVIVLLGSGINRSCSAQFLAVPHNALTPYVEIERELSATEYNTWLEKIRKPD